MTGRTVVIGLVILGGLAAAWVNLGGTTADPSLSRDPDMVDAYGGTVPLAGGSIDLPPPRLSTAGLPAADALGRKLRGMRFDAVVAELGTPERDRGVGTARAVAWLDRAVAEDPDRSARRVAVHLVATIAAGGAVREIVAVASGGRIVGRW